MKVMKVLSVLLAMFISAPSWAEKDYGLSPQKVAENTYVLLGANEHFNFRNGGNIVNTGFIVTEAGVLVVDTGPSRIYGEQMRAAIAEITDLPILRVYNTHLHPDHFLGNQAFSDRPIAALPATIEGIRQQGEMFNDNMYRMAGAWMKGTLVTLPSEALEPGVREIGGHKLHFVALDGHSDADLVVFDETTGVLFAGDLIFHGRTPTTPHAEVATWLGSLDALSEFDFRVLVPGHGAPISDREKLAQTRRYLEWLHGSLARAAERGQAMAEVLAPQAPKWIQQLAVFLPEYQRSVSHLYPRLESDALHQGHVKQEQN